MVPRRTSSMLGWLAAVIETVSPSQPRPAVIQRMSSSAMAGARIRPGSEAATIFLTPRAGGSEGAGSLEYCIDRLLALGLGPTVERHLGRRQFHHGQPEALDGAHGRDELADVHRLVDKAVGVQVVRFQDVALLLRSR